MKILYELKITKETGFTVTDFPDRFEILRKGKTPLVFKPCTIEIQNVYNRLNEAEEILKKASEGDKFLFGEIDEYFSRYSQ